MRRAFTLVELLVVIGIVTVLAALLFPILAVAKTKAYSAQCLSNLHQIGVAYSGYMADSDDALPWAADPLDKFGTGWVGTEFEDDVASMPLISTVLQPYVKSKEVFHCPLDQGTTGIEFEAADFSSTPSTFNKYGCSYFTHTILPLSGVTGTQFTHPVDTVLMFDSAGYWHASSRDLQATDSDETRNSLLNGYRYNVLFADFHSRSINRITFDRAYYTETN